MSNIEVGDYVRTKQGYIAKLIDKDKNCYWFSSYILNQGGFKQYGLDIEKEERIVNHSKNIIDLIEKDDYVNGCRVYEVEERGITVYQKVENSDIDYSWIPIDDIKSIVTKEMYESIKYEVE